MAQPPKLSYECLEELHTWIMVHCPCALEEQNFIPGLKVIIEEEVSRACQAERSIMLKSLSNPSLQ